MITKAKFTNFKLLRDVEIALGRLNVIVGVNGAGKSSVLEGLHYLLQLASAKHPGDGFVTGRPGHLFRGPRRPDFLISKPDAERLELSVEGEAFRQFGLICEKTKEGFAFDVRFQPLKAGYGLLSLSNSSTGPGAFYEEVAAASLSSVVRMRLDATRLAEDHYSDEKAPRIEYDGEGLASVLQEMLTARDGRFEAIEADLAKVVPGVRRIRSTRARIVRVEKVRVSIDGHESWSEQQREFTGSGIEVEWGVNGWIPASHLSEGTLLALGIITILHHRPPRLLLLDDVDKALHPTAQRELITFLKHIISTRPEVQILATTHSSYVVDEFEPGDVLVVGRADEYSSNVRPLSEHPTWRKQRDYLQPGEFWSAVGESWVAEKKASSNWRSPPSPMGTCGCRAMSRTRSFWRWSGSTLRRSTPTASGCHSGGTRGWR